MNIPIIPIVSIGSPNKVETKTEDHWIDSPKSAKKRKFFDEYDPCLQRTTEVLRDTEPCWTTVFRDSY